MQTSISPWITFQNCSRAVAFYEVAFGAIETYRLEVPDGSLVVKLSIGGAEFWLSSGAPESNEPENVGGETIRMILIVDNPDDICKRAIAAGAKEIFPVGIGHGWRLGRIVDPFGLHWEIGHPIST